jgi:hypothetical protein
MTRSARWAWIVRWWHHRRGAGAGLRAAHGHPGGSFYERHFVWLFWVNVAVAALLTLVMVVVAPCAWPCGCGAASSAAGC